MKGIWKWLHVHPTDAGFGALYPRGKIMELLGSEKVYDSSQQF